VALQRPLEFTMKGMKKTKEERLDLFWTVEGQLKN